MISNNRVDTQDSPSLDTYLLSSNVHIINTLTTLTSSLSQSESLKKQLQTLLPQILSLQQQLSSQDNKNISSNLAEEYLVVSSQYERVFKEYSLKNEEIEKIQFILIQLQNEQRSQVLAWTAAQQQQTEKQTTTPRLALQDSNASSINSVNSEIDIAQVMNAPAYEPTQQLRVDAPTFTPNKYCAVAANDNNAVLDVPFSLKIALEPIQEDYDDGCDDDCEEDSDLEYQNNFVSSPMYRAFPLKMTESNLNNNNNRFH